MTMLEILSTPSTVKKSPTILVKRRPVPNGLRSTTMPKITDITANHNTRNHLS